MCGYFSEMAQISKRKIVVVGAGLIGQKHIKVVKDHAQLDAIIDPNPNTREIAKTSGTNWFSSVAEYQKKNRPDGAIIATPNQLHLEHGTAFIQAGTPVLIEKPLAENSENAKALVECSTSSDMPILVGHHRRHSPLVKAAKSAITAGQLGDLVTVNAQFWLYKPDDYFDATWRRLKGGGPTLINLIHDIDLLRHFCSDIVSVQAMESSVTRKFEVEDSSAVILEFENGALGTVSISDTVVAPWSWELTAGENPVYPKTDMSCYTLGGTKGSLSIPDLSLWTHPGKQSWWEPIEANPLTFTPADPVEEQFLHFLDVIENGAAPLVSGVEGMKNLLVLDAIKAAARHGGRQSVAKIPQA